MINTTRFVVAAVLMAAAACFINLHSNISVAINKPFSAFPSAHAGWRMVADEVFSDAVLDVLKPTDYLSRGYVDESGNRVLLYIGYHNGGKESGPIHSPKHCLPGSGWSLVKSGKATVALDAGRLTLVKSLYQQGESKEIFLYWFQVRDRALTNEYALKLAEITGSLFHRRRDTAFIRVSVPAGGDDVKATAIAERFIRDYYPVIRRHLPE